MGKADKAEGGGHKAEQTPPLKVESQGCGALAGRFLRSNSPSHGSAELLPPRPPRPPGAWPRSLPHEYRLANDFFGKAEVT